jgi:hypothetical protein
LCTIRVAGRTTIHSRHNDSSSKTAWVLPASRSQDACCSWFLVRLGIPFLSVLWNLCSEFLTWSCTSITRARWKCFCREVCVF